MSKSEKATITNMYIIENDKGQILIQDRVSSNWPGVTFSGGKVEKNESFVDSMIREVFEETDLVIKNPQMCGTKQIQTENDERYIVLMYKTNQYSGNLRSSDEGEVFWIDKYKLGTYNLANDFDEMFRVMDSDILSEFYYHESWNVHLK